MGGEYDYNYGNKLVKQELKIPTQMPKNTIAELQVFQLGN